jgi:hypothetical protein
MMNPPQIGDLSHRLARLELAVLALTVLLFALVFLIFGGLAFRRQVVLRDRRGKGRLVVGMSDKGDPEIVLWARDSVSWLRMGFDSDGGSQLNMSDRSGKLRFSLAMLEGGPAFCLANDEGETRMFVGLSTGQIPGMTLFDRSGKSRVDLTLDESGGPYLMAFDGGGIKRLAVGMSPSGDPALVFFGKVGEERIGFDADGNPFLHVLDEEGRVINQIHPAETGIGEA